MVPNSDFSLNSNVSSPYTQNTIYSNVSEHSNSNSHSHSNSTINLLDLNLPINENILNINQCAQMDSTILTNSSTILNTNIKSNHTHNNQIQNSIPHNNRIINSPLVNIHNSITTTTHSHSHSHEIKQNDDGSTSTTPHNINVALKNKEQNKLIHLDPVPNFNDKSDIKPWLQKIFYPMGIEIVIERSDSTKVIFKCKASKRGKKNRLSTVPFDEIDTTNTNINTNSMNMTNTTNLKVENADTTECNDSFFVHNTKHITIPKDNNNDESYTTLDTPDSYSNIKLEDDKDSLHNVNGSGNSSGKTKKKRSVSKFNVCPFRIRATYSLKRKKWSIVILNNTHSHELIFNPNSEEYKKFKFKLRSNNELDVIKKFDELEYRVKSNLPINNLTIPCDCGLTNEIASFNIVLPKNNKSTPQRRIFKRTNRQISNNNILSNNMINSNTANTNNSSNNNNNSSNNNNNSSPNSTIPNNNTYSNDFVKAGKIPSFLTKFIDDPVNNNIPILNESVFAHGNGNYASSSNNSLKDNNATLAHDNTAETINNMININSINITTSNAIANNLAVTDSLLQNFINKDENMNTNNNVTGTFLTTNHHNLIDLDEIDFTDFFNTNNSNIINNTNATANDTNGNTTNMNQFINHDQLIQNNRGTNIHSSGHNINSINNEVDFMPNDIIEKLLENQNDESLNWLNDIN